MKPFLKSFFITFSLLVGIGLYIAAVVARGQTQMPDPCSSADIAKLSVALNLSSTGGEVLPVSGTTRIKVCGFAASVAGTTPSLKFRYGTGSVCGTGTTELSGVILPTSGAFVSYAPGGTAFATPNGQALCVLLAGTSPSVQGVLTYVRQ